MRRRYTWLLLTAVFALVVAACGDGEAETTTTTAAPTTTATTAAGETTTTGAEPMVIATDVGVDLDAGVIKVGLLSDLTGPFGPLVSAIVAGMNVYWADVNANGGVNGLQVELVVRDTVYVVDTHVQFYEELKDQVVAFGHSTGSPHTVAIIPQLAEDGILAIPLTWYSGWADPAINANVVGHGIPYCIEAMNAIEYLAGVVTDNGVTAPKLAIASIPGDYGLDSAAGAALAADALGLEVVYDGTGLMIPSDESTLAAVADGIASSGADLVFMTATPGSWSATYGLTLQKGFEAKWTGAGPSWNPAFVAEGSAIRDAMVRDFYGSFYIAPWAADTPGVANLKALMAQYAPDAPPTDYYGEGFVEAQILHEALLKAYDNGDMTQAGVLAAAKSLEAIDFNGLAPSQGYVGDANSTVIKKSYISVTDLTSPTGLRVLELEYESQIAKDFNFTEACYKLG